MMDYEIMAEKISEFIKIQVSKSGRGGIVYGLSGGIDSAVTAVLCKKALGADRCLALIMPHGAITPDEETEDAVEFVKKMGVKHGIFDIGSVADEYRKVLGVGGDRVSDGNLLARIRASVIYYHANLENRLVVGTDDKSEYLIGYFTKYGDGASDILPIRDLYKTEVRQLGRHLGVPASVTEKQPGAHLWKGHTAQSEIGLEYDSIDAILRDLTEGNLKADQIAAKSGVDIRMVENVARMCADSVHKRRLQPFCGLSDFK